MKHNADTIVSLFISSFMSELVQDNAALAGMTPKQQALLKTVCRSAAQDALTLSGTASLEKPSAARVPVTCPLHLRNKNACAC